ncbi:MAG: WD40 repeat domain-containing protein [Planctomycetes bacterium]|nr:WD40 repeat domain-containing protein [Planctomycetota bacterium]
MPRLNPFAWGKTKLAKLWEATIDGHVVSLAWSAPLGLIAAASADGPITLFDAKTGQIRFNLLGHGFGASCVAWSVDGQHLASAGQDGKVRLWNPANGQQLKEMPGGAAWVERVAWCPTANILASAAGKKLRLWNLDGAMIRAYPDHPSTIADIQWKPNDAILASAAYGKLFFWSPEQQNAVREFGWNGSMLAVAWSPNSKHIAVGGQDSTVHFWVLATGDDLQMAGYPTKVRELAWDPTGRYLATGGGPVSCVWDFSGKGPAGSTPIQLDAHKDNITCLTYQHRGALLASGGEDGVVALWQPGKQQGALALARHPSAISQCVWSADDRQLAVATAEGGVLLYTT